MSSYFLTLLTASVCGAVCTLLAWGGFEKYIKYIASLVCILLLISPLKSIDIQSFAETEGLTDSGIQSNAPDLYALSSEMAEKSTEKYITQIVFGKFGINAVYADIRIDWNEKEPTVEAITVALKSDDMHLAEGARQYLESTLGSGVTVIEDRRNA